jgi:hypothetical protein
MKKSFAIALSVAAPGLSAEVDKEILASGDQKNPAFNK